jgi:uncharacterized protein Yka (UPF0111/DUF47 family)
MQSLLCTPENFIDDYYITLFIYLFQHKSDEMSVIYMYTPYTKCVSFYSRCLQSANQVKRFYMEHTLSTKG